MEDTSVSLGGHGILITRGARNAGVVRGARVASPGFQGALAGHRLRPGLVPVLLALFALAVAVVLAAGPARAGGASLSASLDRIMDQAVREGRIPGGVLLVARDGRVLHRKAYGFARPDRTGPSSGDAGPAHPNGPDGQAHPEAMTTEHAFDLASLTKVFATTFAAMLLVDQGRLGLDDPVARHLPAFARPGGPDSPVPSDPTVQSGQPRLPDRRAITVRHLLAHTSGLPAWCPLYLHMPAGTPGKDRAAILECLAAMPLADPPGTRRVYSDLGFILLGLVVESVAGRPLDAFLQESLYAPLGLARTGFRPKDQTPDRFAHLPGLPASSDTSDQPDKSNQPIQPYRSDPAGLAGRPRLPAGPFAATSRGNPYEARMAADPAKDCACPAPSDSPAPPGLPSGRPAPHAPAGGWREYTLAGEVNDGNAWYALSGVAGHAGLFATADDLLVLADLLLDRGVHAGRRFLSAETVDLFLSQGLGWSTDRQWFKAEPAPAGAVGHTGFTGTSAVLVPRDRVAIILLTNRQQAGLDPQGRYPDLSALRRSVVDAVVRAGPAARARP